MKKEPRRLNIWVFVAIVVIVDLIFIWFSKM